MVESYKGRKIEFPKSLSLVGGDILVNMPPDYTIVSWYDSKDCMGCRMMLSRWDEMMDLIDYNNIEKKVKLVIVADVKDKHELYVLYRRSGFEHVLLQDINGEFCKLNQLAKSDSLHTFLLDSDNKVLLVGNPILDETAQNAYISRILDDMSLDNVKDL